MKLRRYTLDALKIAVETSLSYRQALVKLGITAHGGNYQTIKKACKYFSIDTSHFMGQGWGKGSTASNSKTTVAYLINGSNITTHKLRLRILRDGIMPHKCSSCGNTSWLGAPIPLDLHHVNGDRNDNRIENIQLLCPNCHRATNNFTPVSKDDLFGRLLG